MIQGTEYLQICHKSVVFDIPKMRTGWLQWRLSPRRLGFDLLCGGKTFVFSHCVKCIQLLSKVKEKSCLGLKVISLHTLEGLHLKTSDFCCVHYIVRL